MPLLTTGRMTAGGADAVRAFVRQPQRFLLDLALVEGPVAPFSLNDQPYVVLSDPDDVHAVLGGDGGTYEKGALYEVPRIIGGDGILTAEGDDWAAQRAVIHSFFSRARVEALAPSIAAAIARQLDRWAEHEDAVVDVMSATKRAAFEVVSGGLLGIRAGPLADELFDALMEVGRVEHVTVWLLAERFHPDTGPGAGTFGPRALTSALDRVDRAAYELADERLGRRLDPDDRAPVELLDALLASPSLVDAAPERRRTALRDQIVNLLLAGYVTTGESMFWAAYLLARHPEVQARARAEATVGRPYVAALGRETLRLFPATWFTGRVARRPVRLGSRDLAAGTRLIASPYVLHRLPALWPEPDEFRPERFAGSGPLVPRAYLPFGSGMHACLGRPLAMAELGEFVTGLLDRFEVGLDDGAPPELAGSYTLRPRRTVPLRLRRRR
jgi:cytochrome P450